MATQGGVDIGPKPEDDLEWTPDMPLWTQKLLSWKSLCRKGCPAREGPGGSWCSWGGHGCYYNGCPRRIFEEAMITESALPPPQPSANFKQRFNELQQQVNKLEAKLEKYEKGESTTQSEPATQPA